MGSLICIYEREREKERKREREKEKENLKKVRKKKLGKKYLPF